MLKLKLQNCNHFLQNSLLHFFNACELLADYFPTFLRFLVPLEVIAEQGAHLQRLPETEHRTIFIGFARVCTFFLTFSFLRNLRKYVFTILLIPAGMWDSPVVFVLPHHMRRRNRLLWDCPERRKPIGWEKFTSRTSKNSPENMNVNGILALIVWNR